LIAPRTTFRCRSDGREDRQGAVLGWGSTYGSISSAVEKMQREGKSVSAAHLRHLNPFPKTSAKCSPDSKR
jgi:pyruvate/2-oxoacid:ferredoxin oxidoreductase alpha subunit